MTKWAAICPTWIAEDQFGRQGGGFADTGLTLDQQANGCWNRANRATLVEKSTHARRILADAAQAAR